MALPDDEFNAIVGDEGDNQDDQDQDLDLEGDEGLDTDDDSDDDDTSGVDTEGSDDSGEGGDTPSQPQQPPEGYVSRQEYDELRSRLDTLQNQRTDRQPTQQQGSQQEAVDLPQDLQGFDHDLAKQEAALRKQEDEALNHLRNTDIDKYEEAQRNISASRAGRMGYLQGEQGRRQATFVAQVEQETNNMVLGFIEEYGAKDLVNQWCRKDVDREGGLSGSEVQKVMKFAIDSGIHDLEAAYLKMNKQQLLNQASAKGAADVVDKLSSTKSFTQAGKASGDRVSGGKIRDLTEEEIDNMSDEQWAKLMKNPAYRKKYGFDG